MNFYEEAACLFLTREGGVNEENRNLMEGNWEVQRRIGQNVN